MPTMFRSPSRSRVKSLVAVGVHPLGGPRCLPPRRREEQAQLVRGDQPLERHRASRRLGRRAHRHGRPGHVAGGHAADRPRGTAPPRRPVAPHRRRRQPAHLPRHQHKRPSARRSGTASPPTGPLRGPHPKRPRHRPAQPPLHETAQNRIWLEIVSLALDLLAWIPMLALTGETRRWEPKRLRLRLFSTAVQPVRTGRRHWLRLPARWPWTDIITRAMNRLQALPNPG